MSIRNNVQAPPILSSIKLDNNTAQKYDINGNVTVDSLSDGIATLELGYLKNLVEPITDDQAATKNYVDGFSGSATAGGPLNSIQLNDGLNGFTGSNDLVFNKISGLTTLNGTLTNTVISLTDDILTGIARPIDPQDAANKSYVDSQNSLTDVTIEINSTEQNQLATLTYNDLNGVLLSTQYR